MVSLHALCTITQPSQPAEEKPQGVPVESHGEERPTGIAEVPDNICHTGMAVICHTEDDAVTVALAESAASEQINTCTEAQNGPKVQELTCPLLLSKDSKQQRPWSSQRIRLRCRVARNSRLFPRKRIKTSSNFHSFSCAALNRTICKRPAGCGLLTRLCMFCKITTEQPGTVTSVHQKLLCKTPISCVLQ